MTNQQVFDEFDRQVENLIIKGYPKAANLDEKAFLKQAESLKIELQNLTFPKLDLDKGILPFVIVVKSDLVPAEKMIKLVEKEGKKGVIILKPLCAEDFKTIDEIDIPNKEVYLLINIDRGKTNINLPPSEAMGLIKEAKRTPLTIDEGIAIVTQFPEFLVKNNCFSLLGSRTGKDKRVPAIWINGRKEPNLGWCWNGNPHTWLGSASCTKRVS